MTELIREHDAMRRRSAQWRGAGRTIALVPTMGALHAGHLALVAAARARCDRVVTSIFVNPLQFGPQEDLARYPRDLHRDLLLLEDARCDAVFTTTPEAMYPPGFSTYVANDELAARFEGALRPGHFRGVLTVVCKLFHLVAPDVAFFGQKDAQQALMIRRMAADLDFPVEIVVRPTVREPDGLAMSSRNAYLSADGRRRATVLHRALQAARARFAAGERQGTALLAAARAELEREPDVVLDYLAVVDPASLQDLERCEPRGLLLVAARVDGTRLLDNELLEPGGL